MFDTEQEQYLKQIQMNNLQQGKTDCQHFNKIDLLKLVNYAQKNTLKYLILKCVNCSKDYKIDENFICLSCLEVNCSEQDKKHINNHYKKTSHSIIMSLLKLNFYCYSCNSYIINDILMKTTKFIIQIETELNNKIINNSYEQLLKQINDFRIINNYFTLQKFINGLNEKKYNKICIFVGAGMSVAAGIPDFRTPGTGLYSQLQKYNLKDPQDVFNIETFKKNPEIFYKVAKEFLFKYQVKPTLAHQFISWLDKRNQLLYCFTQNIDGLELEAGVRKEKLIQAHGHLRTAKCIECKKKVEIQEFIQYLQKEQILKCKECKNGLIKPDIIFFGEPLPQEFFEKAIQVLEADLAIIIGTSLSVVPFSILAENITDQIPCVVINRENVRQNKNLTLFLGGDIQDNFNKITQQLKI